LNIKNTLVFELHLNCKLRRMDDAWHNAWHQKTDRLSSTCLSLSYYWTHKQKAKYCNSIIWAGNNS